jgi:D-lactate dehydrogenase
MKVVVFETEEWEREACRRLMAAHEVACTAEPLNERTVEAFADAEVVATFINSRLGAGVLGLLPRLRLVATRSTGYDHIDLDYCRTHGINVPGYGDHTVAEHAFALLLVIARNIVGSVERTRRGNFTQSGLRGFELFEKTLGVIGTGRIGRRVIGIARGFGMAVVAHDVRPDEAAAAALGFRYLPLHELLGAADVVTLHVPATAESRQLLSDREFALMKDGAVLINTVAVNSFETARCGFMPPRGAARAAPP